MTSGEYISTLIRPDRALLMEPPRRSRLARWWYARADRQLRRLVEESPTLPADEVARRALAWVGKHVLPVDHGRVHIPQMPEETLKLMSGDCDEGAVLLGVILETLCRETAERMRVATEFWVDGREHCFLTWKDEVGVVWRMDWTEGGVWREAGEG